MRDKIPYTDDTKKVHINEDINNEYIAMSELAVTMANLQKSIECLTEQMNRISNDVKLLEEDSNYLNELVMKVGKTKLQEILTEQQNIEKQYRKLDEVLQEKTRFKEQKIAEIAELKEMLEKATKNHMVARITEISNKIKLEERKLQILEADLKKEVLKYSELRKHYESKVK
jgi:uncharacterized protein YoxC